MLVVLVVLMLMFECAGCIWFKWDCKRIFSFLLSFPFFRCFFLFHGRKANEHKHKHNTDREQAFDEQTKAYHTRRFLIGLLSFLISFFGRINPSDSIKLN